MPGRFNKQLMMIALVKVEFSSKDFVLICACLGLGLPCRRIFCRCCSQVCQLIVERVQCAVWCKKAYLLNIQYRHTHKRIEYVLPIFICMSAVYYLLPFIFLNCHKTVNASPMSYQLLSGSGLATCPLPIVFSVKEMYLIIARNEIYECRGETLHPYLFRSIICSIELCIPQYVCIFLLRVSTISTFV